MKIISMDLYYILENIFYKKNELPNGLRIIHFNPEEHPRIFNFRDGDGPYSTIDELKKKSKRYKKLVRDNVRRVQKICNREFIIAANDSIYYEDHIEEDLDNQLFKMLDHAISGDITKKGISGLHYFHPNFHKVVEITRPKNSMGIWEAMIEAFRTNTNEWIKKTRPSTFFPTEWTKELLVKKIHEAYISKKPTGKNAYQGNTKCGIKIEFILEYKKVISIYPIYE